MSEKDYLDMEKYLKLGAYHWVRFKESPSYREEVLDVLRTFKSIETMRNRTMIDIGCGDGLWVHLLQKNGYNIVGIDPNSLAIELAKSKGAVTVSKGDVVTMTNKYDIGLMFDVFEHVTEPERAVRQIGLTIKYRLYILNPHENSPNHFAQYSTLDLELMFKKKWVLAHESLHSNNTKSLLLFKRK